MTKNKHHEAEHADSDARDKVTEEINKVVKGSDTPVGATSGNPGVGGTVVPTAEMEAAPHESALLRVSQSEMDTAVTSIAAHVVVAMSAIRNNRGERARFNFDQTTLRADVAKIVDRMIFTDMLEK